MPSPMPYCCMYGFFEYVGEATNGGFHEIEFTSSVDENALTKTCCVRTYSQIVLTFENYVSPV